MKTKLFYIALSLLALISCDAHRTIDMEEPSNKVSFGKFTDARDGYTYKTVTINGQTWMAENLRYCPGEPLDNPNVTSRTKPYYYVYKSYDEPDTKKNLRKYGIIYNYQAAQEAVPSGWRLPETSDFRALIASIDKALDGAISRLRSEYPELTESDMQFAILSIIGASDNDMSIVLNVQKQTIYHRRQIVRKHVNAEIDDIDSWLRQYVLSVF